MGNVVEVNSKMRELELQVIDARAQIDRKLGQLMEELPSRLEREVKRIE